MVKWIPKNNGRLLSHLAAKFGDEEEVTLLSVDFMPFGDMFYLTKQDCNEDWTPLKVMEGKRAYRHYNRLKKSSRKKDDIILEFNEDELAAISCFLDKGNVFVWLPILIRKRDINGVETVKLSFMCVRKDGIWTYPVNIIKDLLLQERDSVPVLKDWKQDHEEARKYLKEIVDKYNEQERTKKKMLECITRYI